MYFVISQKGGTTNVKMRTKEEVEKILNDQDFMKTGTFIKDNIEHADPDYWENDQILIIKGDIVVPKSVTPVRKFEL